MTDKPKTIVEALAEVQRNINESNFKLPTVDRLKSIGGAITKKVSDTFNAPSNASTSDYSAAKSDSGGGKSFSDTFKDSKTKPSVPAPSGSPASSGSTATPPAAAPKPEPAKTEPPKPEPAKMSFSDAYNKARQMAKAAGKDENLAQFKFDRGGGEKVYQAAATKSDYVPTKQQFKVDIDAPSTTKAPAGPPAPTTTVDAPLPPKRPQTTKTGTNEMTNPLIAAFLQLQEKNPSNMFEAAKKAKKDHDGDDEIESGKDEYFGSRFAAAKKAGKMKEETEVDEELKGSQHKIDANKNNKIDAHDFKLLRSKKKVKEDAEESKLPKDWGEGVEFSEEELAFFASVEETFTPTEPSRVNKDKAGHTDLTDEVTEAKKKEEPSTERDARQHIQVVAGQAAAGREIDFPHNNGKSTKINPQMGRKITAHLNSLKPAERQAKVKAMHDSPEGMKF